MNGIRATQADQLRLQEKETMLASAFDGPIPLIQLNADSAFSLLYDYLNFLLNYPDTLSAYTSYYANESRLRKAWRQFHNRNLQTQAQGGGIGNINMRSDSINGVLGLLSQKFLPMRGVYMAPLSLHD